MPKVYIFKGLPGCGKSTIARKMVADSGGRTCRVNKDDIREMVHNSLYSSDNERLILKMHDAMISSALKAGRDVIVDSTNLNPIHEKRIRHLVGNQHQVEVMFFNVDIDVCIARDAKREGRANVGEDTIRNMARDWEKKWQYVDCTVDIPAPDTVKYVDGLPEAVIFDIDGTLAHNNGHRSFYDWEKVIDDDVDLVIRDCLLRYHGSHCLDLEPKYIIILSGRDSVCRKETETWLEYHGIPYDLLLMRPENDSRKDNIIKKELFDQNIRGKYNVTVWYDDRDQVVDMARRDLGLKVLQVNYGDF